MTDQQQDKAREIALDCVEKAVESLRGEWSKKYPMGVTMGCVPILLKEVGEKSAMLAIESLRAELAEKDKNREYVTTADGYILFGDAAIKHQRQAIYDLQKELTSVASSEEGACVAVGLLQGKLDLKEQDRVYAWKNVRILEEARQEQDKQIQQLHAEVAVTNELVRELEFGNNSWRAEFRRMEDFKDQKIQQLEAEVERLKNASDICDGCRRPHSMCIC